MFEFGFNNGLRHRLKKTKNNISLLWLKHINFQWGLNNIKLKESFGFNLGN